MGILDVLVFFAFIAAVLCVGMLKSKGEKTSGEKGAEEYFLAGRGLQWWLIGFSLIAANISAEQFVGMSGQGAGLEGISCASWEWIAAISLVVVAFTLLPYFLRTGITTIPEFLEVRYNHWARTLMTVSMMGILVVASLIGVTYAGSLVMMQLFQSLGWNLPFWSCCLIMSVMAGAYVLFGGLKACAWADLLQGSALIVGGAIIAYFALRSLGSADASTLWGWTGSGATLAPASAADATQQMGPAVASAGGDWLARLKALNAPKLMMGRPASDAAMPWTILIIGIWIPNFYYWGLNQYITQRILGSGSLAEGQKGIVLAGALKLIIPFIIIIPGIIAFNLFAPDMQKDAREDFKKNVIAKAEGGTLAPNTFINLGETDVEKTRTIQALALTPEQIAAVEKNNAALDPKADGVQSVKLANYKYDGALGLLITKLIKPNTGVLGFVLAALLGAIVSSLAAVLNATSTLFTMDIYNRYVKQDARPRQLVAVGRVVIVVLMIVGCVVAASLDTQSIFAYIQKMQLYVSPGILAAFVFGLLNRKAGRWTGVVGLLVAPVLYGVFSTCGWSLFPKGLLAVLPTWTGYCAEAAKPMEMHYLWAASYTLIFTLIVMALYGAFVKMPQAISFEKDEKVSLDLTSSKSALVFGLVVVALTIALYVLFW